MGMSRDISAEMNALAQHQDIRVTAEMIEAGRHWMSGAKIGDIPAELENLPFVDAHLICIYRAMRALEPH